MSSVCLSKVCYIGRGGEGEREGEREREREREGKREKERENFTNYKIAILLSMVCYVYIDFV